MNLSLLYIGFTASLVGSLPPGVLNATAIWLGAKRSMRSVLSFGLAVIAVEYVQAYVAILGYDWLQRHESALLTLHLIGIPVFLVLGVRQWPSSVRKENTTDLKRHQPAWRLGLILSALNFFAVPFWLLFLQVFELQMPSILNQNFFLIGTSLGTLLVLLVYGGAAHALKAKIERYSIWIERSISILFFIGALWQTQALIQTYFS